MNVFYGNTTAVVGRDMPRANRGTYMYVYMDMYESVCLCGLKHWNKS